MTPTEPWVWPRCGVCGGQREWVGPSYTTTLSQLRVCPTCDRVPADRPRPAP